MSRGKSLIRASYDRSAAAFSEYADKLVYSFLAAPLADALRSTDGPVLDVASGTGALARLLDGALATDISHVQLLHNDAGSRVVADAEALPFAQDSFAAAGCAFGINHFPDANRAVAEMARVAPLVGLITWVRPEIPFAPKDIVLDVVQRRVGRSRTEAGDVVDELTNATGTVEAITRVLERATLEADVREVSSEVPWPGTARFVDYRMSMTGVIEAIDDLDGARAEATSRIDALPAEALRWRPKLVLGVGRDAARLA